MKFDNKEVTILVIDDEPSGRKMLTTLLQKDQYRVLDAATVQEGIDALARESIDVVLTDLHIGNGTGIDIVKLVQQSYPSTETILLTAYGSIENAVEVIHAGAFDYVTKPFDSGHLSLRVQKAVERKMMKAELTALRQHVAMSFGFDNIIGISKEMTQLKDSAKRIAATDITVLITGASGTGKELFAKAIHHHSERRAANFVAIDCSAIPEQLLESELFGHTKGSFTSAHQNRKGLFDVADGGTIFLDELSNMPESIQVKLLRFLQDSTIRPIGASESKKVNVRVIGATNRDLTQMVAEGKFREDLFYRLNVIPLVLPPLVKRSEDIEILIEYFLRKVAADLGRDSLTIDRQAVEKLQHHSWPGNIRELENTLKRGAALCRDGRLTIDDIVFVGTESPVPQSESQAHPVAKRKLILKGKLLDATQRDTIRQALEDNDWNYTRTAADLGIGRTTLWRKIKKYNLLQDESMVGATETE